MALFDWLRGPAARPRFEAAGFTWVAAEAAGPDAAPEAWGGPPGAGVDIWGAVRRSLWVGGVSLLVSLVPGLLLGTLLARRSFPGKSLLSTALMAPLVLPPVVVGYLLLRLLGRSGPLAPRLEAVGLQVAFSRWGAVVAAAVVGFPLLVLMIRQAIESVDPRYEQLARTLGCSPLQAFFRVTLPMAAPGVAAGCVLAFARALGEFGATAVLAGDLPGETRTLALAIYALYEQPSGEAAATTLANVSLVLCAVALLGYEVLSRAQRRRIEDRHP